MWKKARKILFTAGSAAATAAVMYQFWPARALGVAGTVLVGHEFGHYVTAKAHKMDADPPIFIPLIIVMMGLTHVVPNDDSEAQRDVAVAGPVFGMITAAGIFLFGAFTGNTPVMLYAASAFAGEFFWMVWGFDSKHIVKHQQEMNLHVRQDRPSAVPV